MKWLIFLLSCVSALAQGGSYCTMSTWEPRNIGTKAGLVASYDPGNTNTLTFNGSGVSKITDRTGLGHDLLQGTAANQPYLTNNIGGRPVLFFNGGTHYMKTASFTLNQPEEVYLGIVELSPATGDYFTDGDSSGHRMIVQQNGALPALTFYAGAYAATNTEPTLDTPLVVKAGFNTNNSYIKVNNGTVKYGDAGTQNAGGLTVFSRYDATSSTVSGLLLRLLLCNKTNAPAESGFMSWGIKKQCGL